MEFLIYLDKLKFSKSLPFLENSISVDNNFDILSVFKFDNFKSSIFIIIQSYKMFNYQICSFAVSLNSEIVKFDYYMSDDLCNSELLRIYKIIQKSFL